MNVELFKHIMSIFAVRRRDLLGVDVCGPWTGIAESAGPILSIVVKPLDAHDDHGDDRVRNDRRTTAISQATSRPRTTYWFYAHVLSLVSETDLRVSAFLCSNNALRRVSVSALRNTSLQRGWEIILYLSKIEILKVLQSLRKL